MSTEFVVAHSLDEAFDALTDHEAVAIAGGVAVGLLSNMGMVSTARLVAISRIPELQGVQIDQDMLSIGAAMPHARLAADPLVQATHQELSAMFARIGNIRVRAWGTVGGNLALAEPSQDPPVLLAALGAAVDVTGPGGTRRIPVAELSDGPMSTVLEPWELLTRVVLPLPETGERCAYRKLLPKTADDYATVSAAVRVILDGRRISAARVFCGAVGPVPISCDQAAALLVGRVLDEPGQLDAAVSAVRDEISPVGDHRGSADYKREMAGVFVRRALVATMPTGLGGDSS